MAYRLIFRRDTAANWTANNPVLSSGEPGYESDSGKLKIGDGTSAWDELAYYVGDFLSIDSHMIPSVGNTYDLGATAGYSWRDLYLSGNTIYIGDARLSASGTSISVESMIVGGPTSAGGVVLSATGGYLTSDGDLIGGQGPTGSGGVIEVTYSELMSSMGATGLTPGAYYLITDFKTCYDQPDYNSDGNSITNGNYKESNVHPILVLAISESELASDAYQPEYPKDKIKYDPTWNLTEVTGGTAYGRITERIDEFNNRTDYDHRSILFKRYMYWEVALNDPYAGTVEIVTVSGATMDVNGTGTNFTSLNVGDKVGFDFIYNFRVFEITGIDSATSMTITGLTTTSSAPGAKIYPTSSQGYVSYYQNNLDVNDFEEFYTFDLENNVCINNYIGDFSNLYNWDENNFILANNVFLNGPYTNNKFGDSCFDNTFDDDCNNNIIGNYFYGNITNDDFDGNVIGNWFRNNKITSNFQYNRIGENFQNNYLVQNSFYSNNIMNYFEQNKISGGDFQNNEIDSQFAYNNIRNTFYENEIGPGFDSNDISGETFTNRIGERFENNTISGSFYDNQIFNEFKGNMAYQDFYANKVDWGVAANEFRGFCTANSFGPITTNNDFLGNVFGNVIKGDFDSNTIGDLFGTNNIGVGFNNNTIAQNFAYNEIGNFFSLNRIGAGFGFGGFATQKNYIGDNFYDNTIGEYFYNNRVGNYFQNNTLGDYFQWNVIDTDINAVDFTPNYGNIVDFTYTALGATGATATDNTYIGLTGTTNGHGVNASFDIGVSGGIVIGVTGDSPGKLYQTGNTITISGNKIGGLTGVITTFSTGGLSVKIYKPADSTYEFPSDETEMDYLIDNSPLFDTYYSPNIQGVSYTTKTGVDQNQYAMVIEGYIQIPSDDTYYFGLSSDDGSDAFINGVKVADWYGAHGDNGNAPDGNQYPIGLTAGTYPIKVRLQERSGQDIVILLYSLDSVSWSTIPDNWFPLSVTGASGSYPNILAIGGTGTGEGSTFDVTVVDGFVDSVVLSNGGGSYSVGNVLTIPGSAFGGTQDIDITVDSVYSDDVVITVTEVGPNPSVYESYTCQIFERAGGAKRLSYYDSNDVLTIKNINE